MTHDQNVAANGEPLGAQERNHDTQRACPAGIAGRSGSEVSAV
jgi:hypothetical protein